MKLLKTSASVMLVRSWDSPETYLVLRGATQRVFPSTYVFPGGKVDPADAGVPVRERDPAVPAEDYVAVARELFEETGVLVAARTDGRPLDPSPLPIRRVALLEGETTFRAVLAGLGAEIDGRMLAPLGVKTTPPFHPARFKNRFFLAVLPPGQEPSVLPGELDRGDWMTPRTALARFDSGEIFVAPPVLLLLEILGERAPGSALADLAGFDDACFEDRPIRIRFSPEIVLFPGKTPTLPPATHTNTVIVGADRLLVVDPATNHEPDRKKLLMLLDELGAEGRRVEAVVLTHHHIDHVGSTEHVVHHTRAPLWGHPATAAELPELAFDRLIEDDEVVDLGAGGRIRFLHTPGHAPGHLCLWQEKFSALVAGDMVSTASTILIDPPEGDMALYVRNLERLRALGGRIIYPSHGNPVPDAGAILDHFLAHRREREAKILAALSPSPQGIAELVSTAYADTPIEAHPLAARSLLATLLKLEAEGRARRADAHTWRLPAGS